MHLNNWKTSGNVVLEHSGAIPVMKFESGILYVASKSGNRLKAYEVATGRESVLLFYLFFQGRSRHGLNAQLLQLDTSSKHLPQMKTNMAE